MTPAMSRTAWREIQLDIRWNKNGGFAPAEHEELVLAGGISCAGDAQRALTEERKLTPHLPYLEGHCKSKNAAGGQIYYLYAQSTIRIS